MVEKYTFSQLARRYCDRQDMLPFKLFEILKEQKPRMSCDGWFMLEAQLLDSSYMGSLVILPYGGSATYKTIPGHPVSPRGLASDTSIAVAYLEAGDLPAEFPDDLKDWQPPPPPKKAKKKRSR